MLIRDIVLVMLSTTRKRLELEFNRLKDDIFVQFCPVFQGVNFYNSFVYKHLQDVQPHGVDI